MEEECSPTLWNGFLPILRLKKKKFHILVGKFKKKLEEKLLGNWLKRRGNKATYRQLH